MLLTFYHMRIILLMNNILILLLKSHKILPHVLFIQMMDDVAMHGIIFLEFNTCLYFYSVYPLIWLLRKGKS